MKLTSVTLLLVFLCLVFGESLVKRKLTFMDTITSPSTGGGKLNDGKKANEEVEHIVKDMDKK